jgi:hypothetical protein
MAEPGATPDDLPIRNLRRLCEELRADFEIASGAKRGGRNEDGYRLLSTAEYRAGALSGVAVRRFGRFGNNLRQIVHATFFAEATGARRVHVDGVNVGRLARAETFRGIEFVPEPPAAGADAVLVGRFFDTDAFRRLFSKLDAPRRWQIVSGYVGPMLSRRWGDVPPVGDDVLHIHVRAGDVFGKRVHRAYVQPPMAFYRAVLRHFSRVRRSPRVVLVYEDRGNPCVDALCALLARDRLDFALHHADFDGAVLEMLSATNLAVGTGTFAPMIALVAPRLRRLYAFRQATEHTTFRAKGVEVLVARDVGGGYIRQGEWQNTEEQRARMLDYPDAHVQIA